MALISIHINRDNPLFVKKFFTENQLMSKLFSFFMALCMSGCAAVGPEYAPAPAPTSDGGQALVYIYRAPSLALGGRSAYFYVDDVNVADLSSNGYTSFEVPAGRYKLRQKWPVDVTFGMKTLELAAEWQGGKTYYYRLSTGTGTAPVGFSINWRLSEISPTIALAEMPKANQQPAFGAGKLVK